MSTTHFGFKTVDEKEKAKHVRGVFDSVASKYDVMNDLMSGGLHRAWKAYTVAVANVQPGMNVLDVAGGTGDLARAFAKAELDMLDNALTQLPEFGIARPRALALISEVVRVVNGWQRHFKALGVGTADMDALSACIDRPHLLAQRQAYA